MLFEYFLKFGDGPVASRLLRDYYQLLIIKELFASKYRRDLILRGSSAVYHAYDIGIGNEKIELISLKNMYPQEFLAVVRKITRKFENMKFIGSYDRRYMYSIELEIQDSISVTIKIELSKIKSIWQRGTHFIIKNMRSHEWEYEVIAQVVKLSELVDEHKIEYILNTNQ